jgi:hypothetical protein
MGHPAERPSPPGGARLAVIKLGATLAFALKFVIVAGWKLLVFQHG